MNPKLKAAMEAARLARANQTTTAPAAPETKPTATTTFTPEQQEFVDKHEAMHHEFRRQRAEEQAIIEHAEHHGEDAGKLPMHTPVEDDSSPAEPQPAPAKRQFKIKDLSQRAGLVKLKRGTYRPYMNDAVETEAYGLGTVNKHLFEGKDNRVKAANKASSELYNYVNNTTAPWMDSGTRILNLDFAGGGHKYENWMAEFRRLEAEAVKAQNDLVANWDYEVQQDYTRMMQIAQAKGKTSSVSLSDYPSAAEVHAKYYQKLRFMPIPNTSDFRVGISEEDKQSLNDAIQEAADDATKHVVREMLKPMSKAVERLSIEIGEKGAGFHSTLITNMVDAAERMAKINMSDDPEIKQVIDDLRSLVSTYSTNVDVLKQSPAVRKKMATQVGDLMTKMEGLI